MNTIKVKFANKDFEIIEKAWSKLNGQYRNIRIHSLSRGMFQKLIFLHNHYEQNGDNAISSIDKMRYGIW